MIQSGRSRCWKLSVASYLVMSGALAELSLGIAWSGDSTLAQITPDTTLGTERSVVTPNVVIRGLPSDWIDGGAMRGANLFHSFQQFNIDAGRGAYFTNPAGIENILSRVTGSNHSAILGKLGVLGNANLFLINPNGIIFGPNASLDVRGSFVASTASSVVFADGTEFSTKAPQTTPLLTVSVPIGLQFGENPGSIQAQSLRLQVLNGKTLALVGGNVQLDGTSLSLLGGRVELAGVGGPGTVRLSGNGTELQLSFPDSVPRTDVSLTNGAVVLVVADGGGSIAINARNLNLAGGSILGVTNLPSLSSIDTQAGDIDINSTEATNLTDGSSITNSVLEGGVGKGGDINITTDSLSVTNGAVIVASTLGKGDAGSVNITARDTVSFDGVSSNGDPSAVLSTVESTAEGNAGSINITTGSLSVTNGAQLQASTRGRGDAGSVNILASDHVSFAQSSGVLSTVEQTAKGNGGSINISTGSLSITNSAQMVVGTRGRGDAGSVNIYARDTISLDGVGSGVLSTVESTAEGNAGSINITTGFLSVTNGAQLVVGTRGRGDAGTVNISAHDTVSFDGVGSVGSQEIRSGVFSTAEPGIVGNGGSINITTDFLSVTNRAGVFTTSFGQGNAGDIQIKARDLLLNNRGVIVAETASGNGGNITLNVRDLLLMRRNSIISTTAATAQQGDNSNIGDGGNININAQFIVAVPKEDSNIRADAIIGKGGNIEITTSGIFGFQSPPQDTPLSDITASSDFGVQGAINIRGVDVDPNRGLTNLPAQPVNAELAQGCQVGRGQEQSTFVITGRGGLPPNPKEALSSDDVFVNWVPLNPGGENPSSPVVSKNPTNATPAPLVEAQGWVMNDKGQVVLTASAPTVTPHSSWLPPNSCGAPQSEARTGV